MGIWPTLGLRNDEMLQAVYGLSTRIMRSPTRAGMAAHVFLNAAAHVATRPSSLTGSQPQISEAQATILRMTLSAVDQLCRDFITLYRLTAHVASSVVPSDASFFETILTRVVVPSQRRLDLRAVKQTKATLEKRLETCAA